jgi:tetratricopeptide (TPR) repeat protein
MLDEKKEQEGQRILEAAISELEIERANHHKGKGNHFFREAKYSEAIKEYDEAIVINPDFTEAWLNKGLCQKKLEQYSEAIASFNNVLRIDDQHGEALFHKEVCLEQISAIVFFGIVDLKFTEDGKVKILEMGEGLNSGFSGYDQLYPISMHKQLGEKLKELGLPFFIPLQWRELPFNSIESGLESALISLPEKNDFDCRSLATYSGIYGGITVPATKDYILRLDRSVTCSMASENKLFFHHMSKVANLLGYRPTVKTYSRNANLDRTIKDIRKNFHSDWLVIKAPDFTSGLGVNILEKNRLASELAGILHRFKVAGSNSSLFIVESYEASKAIESQGSMYDPTMRVAYVIVRDNGIVQCHPLGAYWKLPPEPVNSNRQLRREQHISSYSERNRGSEKVSDSVYSEVAHQLIEALVPLFDKMFTFDHQSYIQNLIRETDKSDQAYGQYLRLLRANSYARRGCFKIAHRELKEIIEQQPNLNKGYHELGVAFFRERLYQEALNNYIIAESKERIIQTKIRRAQVLIFLGKYRQAKSILTESGMKFVSNKSLMNILLDYMKGELPFRAPLFYGLLDFVDYFVPLSTHLPDIPFPTLLPDIKTINFVRKQGGESIEIQSGFLKFSLPSIFITKKLRDELNLNRVMIPLKNAKGIEALKKAVSGITIEESTNKKGEPRLLLTFSSCEENLEKIKQINSRRDYDLEFQETNAPVSAKAALFKPASLPNSQVPQVNEVAPQCGATLSP